MSKESFEYFEKILEYMAFEITNLGTELTLDLNFHLKKKLHLST